MSLEVLFNCERNSIKRPEDALLCSIHCCLIASGYKCVGCGEVVPTENVRKSDMLPAGWNADGENYTLMYQPADASDSSTLVLKIVSFDGLLLTHLLRTSDEKAVAIELNVSDFTTSNLSSFESAYRGLEKLEQRLKTELIAPFQKKPVSEAASCSARTPVNNQENERSQVDPLRVPSRRPPAAEWEPRRDPFAIGRGDLDPLQSGYGGGMIFDPLHSSGGFYPRFGGGYTGIGGPSLPRGAIVPGARFDPFGPPDLDRSGNTRPPGVGGYRSGPDPDHMPPPGYDDMFM